MVVIQLRICYDISSVPMDAKTQSGESVLGAVLCLMYASINEIANNTCGPK